MTDDQHCGRTAVLREDLLQRGSDLELGARLAFRVLARVLSLAPAARRVRPKYVWIQERALFGGRNMRAFFRLHALVRELGPQYVRHFDRGLMRAAPHGDQLDVGIELQRLG
jgi:hypothetical protein